MQIKRLIAVAVAAIFTASFGAIAADKSSGSTASSSAGSSGAEKMFQSLDKDKDGFLTKEEVKGTPHDKDFSKLDKNNDKKLSREEHAAAPEHAGDKAPAAGGAKGGSTSPESSSAPPSKGSKY
jgi:hypothetical protein